MTLRRIDDILITSLANSLHHPVIGLDRVSFQQHGVWSHVGRTQTCVLQEQATGIPTRVPAGDGAASPEMVSMRASGASSLASDVWTHHANAVYVKTSYHNLLLPAISVYF